MRPTGHLGVNDYIAKPEHKSRRATCSSVVLCPRHNTRTKGESLVGGHGEISRNITSTILARQTVGSTPPPAWVKPQLAKLVEKAPDGPDWLHELKLDGYRMHARLDATTVQTLTRRGNDWTDKYPAIANAIAGLPAQNAYLDGELCGVLPDDRTVFNLIQNATDTGQGSLVFFLFDLLHLDGENLMALPVVDRKARLAALLKGAPASLRYSDHQVGHGPKFHRLACQDGVHLGEHHRQERHRAVEAGDRGLREGRHRRPRHGAHRRCRDPRPTDRDPRSVAARRYPDPRLYGCAELGRRFHQPRPRRPPAAGGAGGQTAWRRLRCRPWRRNFDYTVAEDAIAQGCPPDTISSDIHVFSGNTPGMPYLTWVMSKFLGLGFRTNAGEGVRIVGRWFDTAARTGVGIFESSDLAAVSRYIAQWNSHMEIDLVPVLDEEEVTAVAQQIVADSNA